MTITRRGLLAGSLAATAGTAVVSALNVRAYGAVGDGQTDDTAAVARAIADWMARLNSYYPADLVFPPGTYSVSHGFTLTPAVGVTGGSMRGYGAKLQQVGNQLDDYLITVNTKGSSHSWQRLVIEGLHLDNGGLYLHSGSSSEFIWNASVDKVHVTNARACALRMTGVFESQVTNSFFEMDPNLTPSDDTMCCILVDQDPGGAQPSSIGIENVSTRGGYRGIRSTSGADVWIANATVLAAQKEGLYVDGVAHIMGAHVEDNWLVAGGSQGCGAAIRVDGTADVFGINAVANTQFSQAPYRGSTSQVYALQMYVYGTDTKGTLTPGHASVRGVRMSTNVPGAAQLNCTGGTQDSVLDITGISSYNVEASAGIRVLNGLTSIPTVTDSGFASPLASGQFHSVLGSTTLNGVMSKNIAAGGILVAGRSCTISEIGLVVTTAGSRDSLIRLGIYKLASDSSNMAQLLVDAGTVDGALTGYLRRTLNLRVSAGDRLLLVAALQGQSLTAPHAKFVSGFVPFIGTTDGYSAAMGEAVGAAMPQITGAFPASHSLGSETSVPRVVVKVA